jgi:hypothetical protein
MIQCPQCGNSYGFCMETVLETHTVSIRQSADDIARGGFRQGACDRLSISTDTKYGMGESFQNMAECYCMGTFGEYDLEDEEEEDASDGCGYSGPLHTFYVERLKPVPQKEESVSEDQAKEGP